MQLFLCQAPVKCLPQFPIYHSISVFLVHQSQSSNFFPFTSNLTIAIACCVQLHTHSHIHTHLFIFERVLYMEKLSQCQTGFGYNLYLTVYFKKLFYTKNRWHEMTAESYSSCHIRRAGCKEHQVMPEKQYGKWKSGKIKRILPPCVMLIATVYLLQL